MVRPQSSSQPAGGDSDGGHGGDGGGQGGGAYGTGPQPVQPSINDNRPTVDDQDRPLNYYTPLRDIFMRPKLPTLRGPMATITTGCLMHMAPGEALYNYAMTQALYHSHRTIKASLYHIAGNVLKATSCIIGDTLLKAPSWTSIAAGTWLADKLFTTSKSMLMTAAKLASPTIMAKAQSVQLVCKAMNICAKPIAAIGLCWAGYVITRHMIEPPPYEAPPGTYPNGGPIIEITQEEAANKAMVFTCPAPLARAVQERVLMCERDVTLIQKVKSIASKWCDNNNITGNQRYQAVSGAVAAALTVPCIEQNVIELATSHAVQQQYGRLQRYLSGIKHQNDPWWSKYLLIRR